MDRWSRRHLRGPRWRRYPLRDHCRWSKRRRSVRCSTTRPPAIRPPAAGWWWPSWDIPPAARHRPANRRSLSFVSLKSPSKDFYLNPKPTGECRHCVLCSPILIPRTATKPAPAPALLPSESERRPCRLLHLALAGHQTFLNAPIGAHQRQDTASAIPAGVDVFSAVRRVTRRHVEAAPGQHLHIASPAQIHGGNAVGALLLRDEGELRFIRRQAGTRIVGVLEGQAPRLVAGLDTDAVDLRTSGAVGCKIQAPAVVRPLRFGIDPRIVRDAGQRLTRQIQRVNVQVAVPGG